MKQNERSRKKGNIVIEIEKIKTSATLLVVPVRLLEPCFTQLKLTFIVFIIFFAHIYFLDFFTTTFFTPSTSAFFAAEAFGFIRPLVFVFPELPVPNLSFTRLNASSGVSCSTVVPSGKPMLAFPAFKYGP